jgi:hypothetical protein
VSLDRHAVQYRTEFQPWSKKPHTESPTEKPELDG